MSRERINGVNIEQWPACSAPGVFGAGPMTIKIDVVTRRGHHLRPDQRELQRLELIRRRRLQRPSRRSGCWLPPKVPVGRG